MRTQSVSHFERSERHRYLLVIESAGFSRYAYLASIGEDRGASSVAIAQARNFDAGSAVYTILSQLETLFAHRGNAHVLLSLREAGPLRFSEIAARIYERSTERLADTSIHRALQRLEQDGLVTADCIDSRHPIYRLTSSGDRQAAVIAALAETMQAQPV